VSDHGIIQLAETAKISPLHWIQTNGDVRGDFFTRLERWMGDIRAALQLISKNDLVDAVDLAAEGSLLRSQWQPNRSSTALAIINFAIANSLGNGLNH
jgi:hypothetical protein